MQRSNRKRSGVLQILRVVFAVTFEKFSMEKVEFVQICSSCGLMALLLVIVLILLRRVRRLTARRPPSFEAVVLVLVQAGTAEPNVQFVRRVPSRRGGMWERL